MGNLIQFTDNCKAISMDKYSNQIPIWPTANIDAGEIGILLKSQYCEEIGTLCEVLIGHYVFFDVPRDKFELV